MRRPSFLVLAPLVLAACGAEDASKPQGGAVSGRVTLEDGRPISAPGASATVAIQGVAHKSGERVQYAAAVQPDGTYRQKVVDGSYRVQRASLTLQHEGRTWTFHDLEPVPLVAGDREASAGIVQDFVWKIRGPRPGSGGRPDNHTHWYGAPLSLNWALYREDLKKASQPPPAGTVFTFTLTPKGPRIDGAPAETLTLERRWDPARGIDVLHDLPRAPYEVTGVATWPGGAKEPLLFELKFANYVAALPVSWSPGQTGGPIHAFGLASFR